MKTILKSFTFYAILIALFIIFMHQIGQDSKSIVLIGLNPFLQQLPADFMNSGPMVRANTIMQEISIYWYIACILSFLLYGLILDIIKFLYKKMKS